jgi:hypothetical protein
MPEENLETVVPPDRAALQRYFREGGLVAILQSNLAGGREQPRVWLSFTARGDLVHTFAAERGVVGGSAVPPLALFDRKVFTPKQEEVREFLMSFGLTRPEAEDVIRAVGTAP